eukprot:100813-Chlamydomonas_euryale.AAC.8
MGALSRKQVDMHAPWGCLEASRGINRQAAGAAACSAAGPSHTEHGGSIIKSGRSNCGVELQRGSGFFKHACALAIWPHNLVAHAVAAHTSLGS